MPGVIASEARRVAAAGLRRCRGSAGEGRGGRAAAYVRPALARGACAMREPVALVVLKARRPAQDAAKRGGRIRELPAVIDARAAACARRALLHEKFRQPAAGFRGGDEAAPRPRFRRAARSAAHFYHSRVVGNPMEPRAGMGF